MRPHSFRYSALQGSLLLALLPAGLAAAQSPQEARAFLPSLTPSESPQSKSGQPSSDQMSPDSGVTLEQLQEMAVTNNPTLRQAKAGIRAAAGRTRQAGLWPNPTVGYTGEEIRGGSFGGGQHGVFVQQNVILGGKLGLDQKVFTKEGEQAEAEAEEQRLRVENGVRIAFYESLAAQQMVEMRKKLSRLANDAVETTQQLFNVGQADQPDVLQAQVEADEADLAIVTAEQEQQRAWRVLAAVVGSFQIVLQREDYSA